MERLTKTISCQDEARLYDISNELFGLNISRADKTKMILQKLAEYEDLEEQGRLFKLPCMDKFLESVSNQDFDGRISEVVEMLEEKQLYGTISLIKDLKYYLDLATKEKAHTCDCQHNRNSRENEPCCRCDSRKTNADRLRNMSDEELAEFLITFKNTFGEEYEGEASCMDWLQSEAE